MDLKEFIRQNEKMNSSLITDWSKEMLLKSIQMYADKQLILHGVIKRVFIVEILEKDKGWNAISVNLETYEEAFSFFDSHRKDYSHGEIRIVQVHVC